MKASPLHFCTSPVSHQILAVKRSTSFILVAAENGNDVVKDPEISYFRAESQK